MKKVIYIFVFLICRAADCQVNLVPNPSFETYTACPSALNTGSPDEIQNLNSWFSTLGTPDCFNSCSQISSNVNSPSNLFGYREPYEGSGYCGIHTFFKSSLYREVLSAPLNSSMTTGIKYFVSFRIAAAGNYQYNCCGINKAGVKFSKNKFDLNNTISISNNAHVYNNLLVTDTLNWTLVKGVFISDSNYNYINIGNFFDDANTNTVNINASSSFAYCYIDDVRVSTDSLLGHALGTKEDLYENTIALFPNPVIDFLSIKFKEERITNYVISSSIGEVVKSDEIELPSKINLSHIKPGFYYIKIKFKNSDITINKIIIKQ